MGFLIDDCAPQNVNDVFFHEKIYDRLKIMSKENNIPHVIFHGEPGSGKKTMVNIFLDMIFHGEAKNLTTNKYEIPGSGSKVKEQMIEGSHHHIIIKPTGTNFDRYLVHNVVKSYATSRSITMQADPKNTKFRVIQISHLDRLSTSAQNSLRRMIEVNSNRCRFIMWADNLSNVIGPLKSRSICIRVPRPTGGELFTYLTKIAIEHGKQDISLKTMHLIVEYSKNDIKTALWALQYVMLGYSYKTNYDKAIENIATLIRRHELKRVDDIIISKTPGDKISGIRDRLFNLMITNFEPKIILRSIMQEFLKRDDISEKTKMEIVMQTSKTEHDMVRARREIIHFDAYVAAIMFIIYNGD